MLSPIHDPMTARNVISATERAQHEALFDEETGLPGGALLLDRVRAAVTRAQRDGTHVAVFYLDNLRRIDGGTPDMRSLGKRLQSKLRPMDTVARLGRRALVIVCGDLRRDEDAALVAQRLVHHSGAVCSLGIAFNNAPKDAEAMIVEAAQRAKLITMPTVGSR